MGSEPVTRVRLESPRRQVDLPPTWGLLVEGCRRSPCLCGGGLPEVGAKLNPSLGAPWLPSTLAARPLEASGNPGLALLSPGGILSLLVLESALCATLHAEELPKKAFDDVQRTCGLL